MEFGKITVPVEAHQADRLIRFWEDMFQTDYAGFRPLLAGAEVGANRNVIYTVEEDGRLCATAHLTVSTFDPSLGGLGEVAVAPESRGKGLADRLCRLAVDDFTARGGRALFLATRNPAAAALYRKIGFAGIDGSDAMVHLASVASPERFLREYFRPAAQRGAPTHIAEGSAAGRIPLIPLLLYPHPFRSLDANAEMFSVLYRRQSSCMGLYPRYEQLARDGRGSWFMAVRGDGRLVGLSTARLDDQSGCRVDGFVHGDSAEAWHTLMDETVQWGERHGASRLWASAPADDEEKRRGLAAAGFRDSGTTLDDQAGTMIFTI